MSDSKKSDEIDVVESLINVVRALRANALLIAIFICLGLALGLTFFFTSRKVYEDKMIINSEILTESLSKVLFDNSNRYASEGNRAKLAAQLNISEKAAAEINNIDVAPLTKLETEDKKESGKLQITVEVFDQSILPELQNGLIHFLENNEFAKVREEQRRGYYKQMLVNVEKEIGDMQEFKERIFKGDFFQSNKGNVMFNPMEVNTKILELLDRKIDYQNQLQIVNNIQVIDSFTRFDRPKRPKIFADALFGLLAGFLSALLVMCLRFIIEVSKSKTT